MVLVDVIQAAFNRLVRHTWSPRTKNRGKHNQIGCGTDVNKSNKFRVVSCSIRVLDVTFVILADFADGSADFWPSLTPWMLTMSMTKPQDSNLPVWNTFSVLGRWHWRGNLRGTAGKV